MAIYREVEKKNATAVSNIFWSWDESHAKWFFHLTMLYLAKFKQRRLITDYFRHLNSASGVNADSADHVWTKYKAPKKRYRKYVF